MSLIILKTPTYVGVIAALIPSLAFLMLLFYYIFIKPVRTPKPKIVTLHDPLHVIGVATKTSKKTFFEDDLILWKEYKRVREKKLVENKKEEHSFLCVRKRSETDENWEYLIGDIVHDLSYVPTGLKAIEIPPVTYACFDIYIKDEHSWAPAISKMHEYVCHKWLPKSQYELNSDAIASEIEYHDKRTEETTHTMKFYVAIRPKGS